MGKKSILFQATFIPFLMFFFHIKTVLKKLVGKPFISACLIRKKRA